jgi:hypothetical protein
MKKHLLLAERLASLMDTKFKILGIRFGLDPLLDFIPGIGSFIAAAVSCYLFWIAWKLKVPSHIYVRMGWHILLDFILGEIPLIGWMFDIFYRANTINLKLLRPFVDPEILVGEVI